MPFKATLDIVLALQALRTHAFRRQGTLRFRVSLLILPPFPLKPTPCTPYNIYKPHPQHSQLPPQQDSYIDNENDSYYSRLFETRFNTHLHPIAESCFFKATLPADALDSHRLALRVELLFAP